jgi:hypothetical protein
VKNEESIEREVTKMKNPRAVAKRIAELHNEGVRPSAEMVELPVKKATTIGEEVIWLSEEAIEDASVRTTEETLELHRTLLAFAQTNVDAYFEWLRELMWVNGPSEFIAISMKHSQQQFETFRQQTRELVGWAQKAAMENMGPLGTLLGSAFIGRPDLS